MISLLELAGQHEHIIRVKNHKLQDTLKLCYYLTIQRKINLGDVYKDH